MKYYQDEVFLLNHINYNKIASKLNKIIELYFDNKFTLKNYNAACLLSETCLKNANNGNKTLYDFINFLSTYSFADILKESLFLDISEVIAAKKYNLIDLVYNTVPQINDFEDYIFIEGNFHKNTLIQLIEKQCNKLESDKKKLLPVFDQNNEIIDNFIRSLIIKSTLDEELVAYYEIDMYYSHKQIPAIYYLIDPIKKCMKQICVVFVPYRVFYGRFGCTEINYFLYSGVPSDILPLVHFYDDIVSGVEHYNKNLQLGLKHGIQAGELFSSSFKTTKFFSNFVSIPSPMDFSTMIKIYRETFDTTPETEMISVDMVNQNGFYFKTSSPIKPSKYVTGDPSLLGDYKNYIKIN